METLEVYTKENLDFFRHRCVTITDLDTVKNRYSASARRKSGYTLMVGQISAVWDDRLFGRVRLK